MDFEGYVERAFEQRMLAELMADRWVLLLGPRQHGKTSGLMRVKRKLVESGYVVVSVDLQAMPPCNDYEEVVEWFASQVAADLDVAEFEPPEGARRRDLVHWLSRAVPDGLPPLVVLIDEAGGIPDREFRNSFFGQIRAIANKRVEEPVGSMLKSLLFIFSGTFRPEDLVDERNSPFNVCELIRTESVSREAAAGLWAAGTGTQDDSVVDRVYAEVGGQPYLLQTLFARAGEVDESDRLQAVEDAVVDLRTGSDSHLEGMFGKIVSEASLTDLVSKMVSNGNVPNEPANADHRYLETLGVASRDEGRLVFSNSLYRDVAAASVQLIPESDVPTAVAQLFTLPESAFSHMADEHLQEIAHASYRGAVEAYRSRSYRLALAGFGASLEAVLIDFLASLDPGDLAKAVDAAGCNWNQHEDSTRPITFRLVNLLKTAGEMPQITTPHEVSDPVREWRNQIHPAVALQNFHTEESLEPEARMSSALVSGLLRDIQTP
jgi:hypothetical protein